MEHLNIITEVANKVVNTRYPSISNRYIDYDVAVILHSYFVVMEHLNEVPKTETVQEQSPVSSSS